MAGDKKLSEFENMGYDNSTPVLIPAIKYSSSEAGATKENRNIPLELFYNEFLFSYRWADYLVEEKSWLRCDNFSWHSGDSQQTNSYSSVYQHLLNDYNTADLEFSVATQNANLGSNNWQKICYGADKFVALSYSGYLSTSNDGETWSNASLISNLNGRYWHGFIRQGNKFYALSEDGYITISTDGTTWNTPIQIVNLGNNSWRSLLYADGKFVALSNTGYISTSDDGENWSQATQLLGSNSWRILEYAYDKFYALSDTGYISTSTDCETWSNPQQILGNNNWRGLIYKDNKLYALSFTGYMSISNDGENWGAVVQNNNLGDNSWRGFTLIDGKIYAIGQTGYLSIYGNNPSTETISGITISYYQAKDGHKICLADQESNLINLYDTVGIAWYYLLDTTNMRFKLPRINPAKKELLILPETLGVRGNGKTLTWYDNYGNSWGTMSDTSADYNIQLAGAGSVGSNVGSGTYASVNAGRRYYAIGITPDVEKSGLVADLSSISRLFSGQKYLYCYVGNFTKSSLDNIAGQNLSNFNGKADTNLLNVSNNDFSLAIERSGKIYVKEAYINGTSGYIVLSNNVCKQWGTTRSQNTRINFLKKPYKDLPCMTWGFVSTRNGASYDKEIHYYAVDKNGFTTGTRIIAGESPAPSFMWEAIGELEV